MPTITQAGIVVSSLTNVPASSYSFVAGFTTHWSAAITHTINITTHAVGNLLVSMPFAAAGTTVGPFTAPSGTGTTAWADSGASITGPSGIALWLGRVSAIGTNTITVPYTATGTAVGSCLNIEEFTCPGVDAGTLWTVDNAGSGTTPAASTALTFPTLAPSPAPAGQSPEIYVGNMGNADGLITAGNTSGFTYTGSGGTDHAIGAFNTNVSGPVGPNANGGAASLNPYLGVAGLIKATIAHAIFDNIRIYLQPVPTGRMWIISQIGFEFLPSNTLQTITANIVLNNRVIKPGINPNAGQFQGPPYVTVRAGDTMWVDLFGVPVGASAIANFLYNEYSAYAVPHDLGGVV